MTALARLKQDDIAISGLPARLDLAGALLFPDEGILVVADLHLEKGSSFARRGQMLPPYDTRETLAALALVVARHGPRTVIALGDSFHDVDGPARLGRDEREAIAAVQAGRDWIWITGNHDRALPPEIGGEVAAEFQLGPLTLRHEPKPGEQAEIAGHLHPAGRVVLRGRGVRRRCFLTDGRRCVLPAFGAYAGGLNACDPAFRPLFPGGFTAHLLGEGRIFAVGRALLAGD